MEEEDFPCPKPFFLKQQTIQIPKEKSNPNHKHQNAIAGLLLSHKKLQPQTPQNIQLWRQILRHLMLKNP